MNKIIPTKGHTIVEPNEKPKEVSGLALAGDQQNSAPVHGVVLEVAEGSRFQPGQTIWFRKYAIDTLDYINDSGIKETVYVVDESEVLAYQDKSPEVQPSNEKERDRIK